MDKRENITHKQHYVWRAYLRPWCTCVNTKDDIYFIWWNNMKIHKYTNVYDVLREKNFYEFVPLNKLELFLLEELFYKKNSEVLAKINAPIFIITKLVNLISSSDMDDSIRNHLVQAGEDIQTNVEKSGIEFLQYLYNKDLSFLQDDDKKAAFLLFICFQYFRTKKMKENVVGVMDKESEKIKYFYKRDMKDNTSYDINWNNIFNYGALLLSNALCYNLLIKEVHFQLLVSNNARFIVSDQPIYNELGDEKDALLLFYPISPYLAIRGSIDYDKDELLLVDDNEVLNYNYKTYLSSNEFFMGKEEIDVGFKCH